MQPYRRIVETQSDQLSLPLPEALVKKMVEVTIHLVEEPEQMEWPDGFINRFWGCIPDFPEIESEGLLEEVENLFLAPGPVFSP